MISTSPQGDIRPNISQMFRLFHTLNYTLSISHSSLPLATGRKRYSKIIESPLAIDYVHHSQANPCHESEFKMYFSAVVWMGDMNFRIRDFTREEVISKVQGEYIQEFNVDILVN